MLDIFISKATMFTESMTYSELFAEYERDRTQVDAITMKFSESNYVQKILEKNRKQKELVIYKTYVSNRNNLYAIIITCTKATKKGEWEYCSTHVGFINTNRGMTAAMFYANNNAAVIYPPHFFKRYKERLSQIADWNVRQKLSACSSIPEIASVFISRNSEVTWIETDSVYGNKTHIFAPINDGVILMEWDVDKKILKGNTFLTENMLSEKQAKMVEYSRIYIAMSENDRAKYAKPNFLIDESSVM